MLGRYSSEIRTGCANERPSGSVRGAPGNWCPYRDRQSRRGTLVCKQGFELSDIPVGSGFSIDFDSRHRVLRVSPFGIITDEIMSNADAAVRRFLAQEGAQFGIFDYSAVTQLLVSSEYVRDVAQNKPAVPSMKLRVAIAPQPMIYGMNRMYSSLIDGKRSDFQVVHTMSEAEALIGLGTLTFSPTSP